MKVSAFAAAASVSVFAIANAKTYFEADFNDGNISDWVIPDRDGLGAFKLAPGEFFADEEDLGLQTSEDAKFYSIASKFSEPFDNTDDTLVIQLSVKHEQGIDCGGGYVKIYDQSAELSELDGESPYNIMFGPDICGSKKIVHVIFSHKGENYLIKKSIRPPGDVFSHAYTLIVKSDNTYDVLIDNKSVESGSLTDDWNILLPKKIEDPEASKPDDWVDAEMMDDPTDEKPDDWDDIPKTIPDPGAEQPEDWDEDMDGEYEIPLVPNPEYSGEWTPAQIKNPDYKGPWEHPLVDNPDYKDDPTLYAYTSGAVGIDIWQVKSGSIFDDILITSDVEVAKNAAAKIIKRKEAEEALKKVADEKLAEENKKKADEMADQDANFQEDDDDDDDEDYEEEEDERDEL